MWKGKRAGTGTGEDRGWSASGESPLPPLEKGPSALQTLVPWAFETVQLGILVVAHDGTIVHYNAPYAQLRGMPLGALVGQPVEALERRQRLRQLLQTGLLLPDASAPSERRQSKQALIPVWDGGVLYGAIVLIPPEALPAVGLQPSLPRLPPSDPAGPPRWPVRYTFADIRGSSPALGQVRALAQQAAQSGSSVLVLGESGTGKEVFAQAIHAASARRAAPFIPVDCAAMPRDRLEAELFGYAPGALPDAAKAGKPGTVELATHGTLFLNEIGEMPLDIQAKLLRILQERRVLRVGGVTPVPVACTIIAATTQDLDRLVAQGRFRRDLLYRLEVIRLALPPLRERPDDIPHLVEHYWATKSQELGKTAQLSAAAMRLLEAYSWPGNIHELVHIVERLLVGTTKPVIEAADLSSQFRVREAGSALRVPRWHLATVLAEVERRTLEGALAQARGNRQEAAALLGVSRASFYRKAKLYGLLKEV